MSCFACCAGSELQQIDAASFKEITTNGAPGGDNSNKSNVTTSTNNNRGKSLRLRSIMNKLSTRTASTKQKITEEIQKIGKAKSTSARTFTYQELVVATNNFNPDCLIGEGGFGRVYKGRIKSINQDVAVKQLDRNGMQGSREFFSEVVMLSLVQHPNLVNLIGYCAEGDQRILVYEYMPNGSLENHLLDLPAGRKPLDWDTRMKIAQGAAKGLEYLHDYADPPIIYRDFKASNILLDADFNPKLSDFGLAKLGPTEGKDHVSTRVMGTYGYCAPEYALTGQLTTKSDVYSFGVVFLEVISGKRVIDVERPSQEQNLIEWAEPLFKDRQKFTVMADPLLEGQYPVKGLYQALAVAAMCLQEDSENRPLMGDVVTALEFLSRPKKDASESQRTSSFHGNSLKEDQVSLKLESASLANSLKEGRSRRRASRSHAKSLKEVSLEGDPDLHSNSVKGGSVKSDRDL